MSNESFENIVERLEKAGDTKGLLTMLGTATREIQDINSGQNPLYSLMIREQRESMKRSWQQSEKLVLNALHRLGWMK